MRPELVRLEARGGYHLEVSVMAGKTIGELEEFTKSRRLSLARPGLQQALEEWG